MNLNFVINRAKNIIVNPKAEWIVILAETKTKNTIVKEYALPMVSIMAICSFFGSLMMAGSLAGALVMGAVLFVFFFIGIYVSAYIINELTTSFNSKKDIHTTFKLVVYSFTAYFATSAITLLWPPLILLSAFGLYSIYLFWEGTTILLRTPEDNKIGFVAVSSLIIIGVYAILNFMMDGIRLSVVVTGFLGQK
jgi:hypothetical protein